MRETKSKYSNQKRKGKRGLLFSISLFVIGVMVFTSWTLQKDAQIYQMGERYLNKRKWGKAIEVFNMLLKKYPDTIFKDNALFWIGFSLEHRGEEEKAFNHFEKFVKQYPDSPWWDDATVHQIFLAKKLYLKGRADYIDFLRLQLSSSDAKIRFQAALTLGELRDPSALPILKEIVKDRNEDVAKRAMNLMRDYEEIIVDSLKDSLAEDVVEDSNSKESVSTIRIIADGLRKKGERWTEKELLINGLYHIIPHVDLAFYLSLEYDWDKKEWWRRFWAERDPTPTTPENEAFDEFKRRVLYAWKNFGKEWGSDKSYYPPWDSRGELYIKYGHPDYRDTKKHIEWEEWIYYKYRVVFIVSNRISNRTGKGILLAPLSVYSYSNNIAGKRSYFIKEPRYLFINPVFEENRDIKNFKLWIDSTESVQDRIKIEFVYKFPVKNLRIVRQGKQYVGHYDCRWVVYDDNYNMVKSSEGSSEVRINRKSDLSKQFVTGNIDILLPEGSYILALRIEDKKAKRIGLYKKKFLLKMKRNK